MSEKTLEQQAIDAMIKEGFAPDQMSAPQKDFFIIGFMCGYIQKNKETIEKLEKLADATKRSKSFLVAEAVDRYLHEQDWQVSAIKDGLQQAENGQFAADNEVHEFFKNGE